MSRLKLSQYLTISDQLFSASDGQKVRLVLSGRTGWVGLVRDSAVCALNGGLGAESLDAEERAILERAEVLVAHDTDELANILKRNREAANSEACRSFILVPSFQCNMGCAYCGQTHRPEKMSANVEAQMIERVLTAIASEGTRAVQVCWFGAEPLMGKASLLRASRRFVDACEPRGVHYAANLVTNGSLLTLHGLSELHVDARVSLIEITLDGPSRVHEVHRPLKLHDSQGSFGKITRLLQDALASPQLQALRFKLRTNVSASNAAHVHEYLHTMKQLGFGHSRVMFDLHPVHEWSNDVSAVKLRTDDYARLEVGWLATMLELGLQCNIVPSVARPVVCSAVTRSAEVVGPNGNIFGCTEHPLVPQHEAADVLATLEGIGDTLRPLGGLDDFEGRVLDSEVPCGNCPNLGICGGACPKHWSEGVRPCPSYKYNIQARLALLAQQHGLRLSEAQ